MTHTANEHHRILDNIRKGVLHGIVMDLDPRTSLEDNTVPLAKTSFLRSATAPKADIATVDIDENHPDEGEQPKKKEPEVPQNRFVEKLRNQKQMAEEQQHQQERENFAHQVAEENVNL